MQLDDLLALEFDSTVKGMPANSGMPVSIRDMGKAGWNLLCDDIPTPLATLDRTQMGYNSRWMRLFTEHYGIRLCPHGKTTMAPQLFKLQLEDGAFGITVATTQQLRVCRKYGVNRVIMANQLVGRSEISSVLSDLEADPDFIFYCLIDSEANLNQLYNAGRSSKLKRPLQVLLELGVPGGRTGCRTIKQSVKLAKSIAACGPYVELAGIEGFEGVITDGDPVAARNSVGAFVKRLTELYYRLSGLGLLTSKQPLLSIGGSIYFDLVTLHPEIQKLRDVCQIVLRSGCYLTHDSKMMRENFDLIRGRNPALHFLGDPPAPALRVWGRVQSCPEPGLSLINIGKRDVSYDIDLPVAEYWYRKGLHKYPIEVPRYFVTTQINDQHLFLSVPQDAGLIPGDLIAFGLSHPCTTFDKWKLIHVIDDRFNIVDAVVTFF